MEAILALPLMPVITFKVGDLVVNFGQAARVLAVDAERGLLLRALPDQGFETGRDKWYADPAKCDPAL